MRFVLFVETGIIFPFTFPSMENRDFFLTIQRFQDIIHFVTKIYNRCLHSTLLFIMYTSTIHVSFTLSTFILFKWIDASTRIVFLDIPIPFPVNRLYI